MTSSKLRLWKPLAFPMVPIRTSIMADGCLGSGHWEHFAPKPPKPFLGIWDWKAAVCSERNFMKRLENCQLNHKSVRWFRISIWVYHKYMYTVYIYIYNIILTDLTAPGTSDHPCLLLAHHFYWSKTGTTWSPRAETPNEPDIGGAWPLLMHHVMATFEKMSHARIGRIKLQSVFQSYSML